MASRKVVASLLSLNLIIMTFMVMVMVRGTTLEEFNTILDFDEEHKIQLDLGKPFDILVSHGGRIRSWEEMGIAHLSVGCLELEPDALLLPQYTDTNSIAFVTQG